MCLCSAVWWPRAEGVRADGYNMSEDETEPKLYRWGDDDSDDGFLGEDPAASAPSLPVGSLAHLRATPQADQAIVCPPAPLEIDACVTHCVFWNAIFCSSVRCCVCASSWEVDVVCFVTV